MSPGFRRVARALTLMFLRKDRAQSRHHPMSAPGPWGRGGQSADQALGKSFHKKHESEVRDSVPRRPGLTALMTP